MAREYEFTALKMPELNDEERLRRADEFLALVKQRRSVREFSSEPIDRRVIDRCLLAAGSAPSGANQQPWHFAVVESADVKRAIRHAAEEEEREFYQRRAPDEWLDALAPLGTDANKPFLESAPYLIAIFRKTHGEVFGECRVKHYYTQESVGIATGVLITALHSCGLATLTHTPSPMGFLNQILNRPATEKPFLLLVVGKPAAGVQVPVLSKHGLGQISSTH